MREITEDIMLLENMRKRSYAPYSHFNVAAVLKAKNGRKYTGCNVENHGIQAYCAERVAFLKAISEGERFFESITIMGGPEGKEAQKCLPCGYCRQFMSEFVDEDFKIYNIYDNKVEEYTLKDLLPHSFDF